MRTRIVEGTTEITSDGEILFHTFDGGAEFNALGKNYWTSPNNIIGDYEEINILDDTCQCEILKKATTFKELVELVKQSEDILIKNGYNKMGDRISIIRGIYYGTSWGLDYITEKSSARNFAFNRYTASDVVADAREVLKCSEGCKAQLFRSLYDSAEVFESTTKAIDFGHVIIGLDSRRSYRSKKISLGHGGTGLEMNTWVGDLGGGTANLSQQRILNPQKRARTLFPVDGHSYGSMVNLEGDIAAYVVGMSEDEPNKISDSTDNFKTIHEALADYFDKKWNKRAFYFLAMMGLTVKGNKIYWNRNDVIEVFAAKFEEFSTPYLSLRNISALPEASNFFKPVSNEVASIFFDALLHVINNPQDMITARTDPNPQPKAETLKGKLARKSKEIIEEIKKNK